MKEKKHHHHGNKSIQKVTGSGEKGSIRKHGEKAKCDHPGKEKKQVPRKTRVYRSAKKYTKGNGSR